MIKGLASRRVRTGLAAVAAAALVVPLTGTAQAAPGGSKGRPDDIRSVGSDYNNGKPLRLSKEGAKGGNGKGSDSYKVGTTRRWPALDDANGTIYSKNYVLRGVGENVEVWVAKDLAFPAGDCRNTVGGGEGIVVTDEQVATFIDEFQSNIYPKMSTALSTPPSRDGSITPTTRLYAQFFDLPARNFKGEGDRIVTLVDNVRDSNFFTPTAADGKTYIAGFFYSVFNQYTNRNLLTLDAWDWIHRTGANPPDDSAESDYQACSDVLGRDFGDPRTQLYEGTFAHEYQHLLEYYASPGEANWVNEGLSDWAQTLVGYVNPQLDPENPEADSHLATWMGFSDDPSFGGPEQSLTRWEDQGAPEILADYGIAYAFMEYLYSNYGGEKLTSALHTEDENGIAGLELALAAAGYPEVSFETVLRDFLASMAVDQQLEGGKTLVNGDSDALSTESLSARINWETPEANGDPGAPTNGGDFVLVPGSDGTLTFNGGEGYPARPVEWTQDGGRLYSGSGDNLDRGIARQVSVPTGNATMTLELEYQTELSWDFAFVQVYDAAAGEWVSLENANTTSDADPEADPAVQANLPGFTGSSGGVTTQSFDLSAYEGQTVWVAVRYITDGAVVEPGVWLSGMTVGDQPVPDATTLGAWKSMTEAVPVPVEDWIVQLVGWNGDQVSVVELPLDEANSWTGDVSDTLGVATPQFAGLIVTALDRSESIADYAPYELTAGGVSIADGGGGA